MWGYSREIPDSKQINFMEVGDGLIQHHRIYWD